MFRKAAKQYKLVGGKRCYGRSRILYFIVLFVIISFPFTNYVETIMSTLTVQKASRVVSAYGQPKDPGQRINPDHLSSSTLPSNSTRHLKEILLWTSFYKDQYYGLSQYGQAGFVAHKCPVNTCTITNDRTRLQTANAVVVHVRNIDMKPLPERQNVGQVFVFFLHEAPPATFWNEHFTIPDKDKASFNLTITYRYDSDIVQPGVGTPVRKQRPAPYVPRIPLKDRPRSVVWFSSHCNTPGKRELYIKALAKHIDVDIYGRCGTHNCSYNDSCNNNLDKTYKFYISAENTVCLDYVTEKVNKALNMEIVPIVYGGLDYRRRMPPNSFIDIMSFTSPRELAGYLKELMADEERYWEFFAWKGRYRRVGVTRSSAMCKLCQILHDPGYHKEYRDIVKWWVDDRCSTTFIDNLIAKGLV